MAAGHVDHAAAADRAFAGRAARPAAPPDRRPDEIRLRLQRRAAELADFYGRVADQVGQAAHPGLGQRVRWPAASAAASAPAPAPAAAPALEPVRPEDPAWGVATDGDGGAADVGSSAAELDVGMAESMLARNTATVAGTLPSVGPEEPEVLWVHEHLRHLRSAGAGDQPSGHPAGRGTPAALVAVRRTVR